MATVLLPMGYPLQSGQEYQHIIYQGAVVRSYTLPKDPRSATQIQNRRFLSDFAKMRSTAGTFARAAMRSSLGSTWSTIVYQYAKADIDSCWSNAVDVWASFSEIGRDAWRSVAPYEATFNDKGLIFFAMLRVCKYVCSVSDFDFFGIEEWGEEQSAVALAWWVRSVADYLKKGFYDLPASALLFSVSGDTVNNASAFGGSYLDNVTTFEFLIYGYNASFRARRVPGLGVVRYWFDGRMCEEVDISNAIEVWQTSISGPASNGIDGRDFKGLHHLKVEVVSGSVNIDSATVY